MGDLFSTSFKTFKSTLLPFKDLAIKGGKIAARSAVFLEAVNIGYEAAKYWTASAEERAKIEEQATQEWTSQSSMLGKAFYALLNPVNAILGFFGKINKAEDEASNAMSQFEMSMGNVDINMMLFGDLHYSDKFNDKKLDLIYNELISSEYIFIAGVEV
jgi:hypothetical protein